MLEFILAGLKCDFCEKGNLTYSPSKTFDAYFIPETFALLEIDEIIDKHLNEYLVFECRVCNSNVRYTFKDVEKKIRNDLYKKVIEMAATKEFKDANAINFANKTLIYCGKCNGIDGKGSCFIKIFEDCKLKRLPSEL